LTGLTLPLSVGSSRQPKPPIQPSPDLAEATSDTAVGRFQVLSLPPASLPSCHGKTPSAHDPTVRHALRGRRTLGQSRKSEPACFRAVKRCEAGGSSLLLFFSGHPFSIPGGTFLPFPRCIMRRSMMACASPRAIPGPRAARGALLMPRTSDTIRFQPPPRAESDVAPHARAMWEPSAQLVRKDLATGGTAAPLGGRARTRARSEFRPSDAAQLEISRISPPTGGIRTPGDVTAPSRSARVPVPPAGW
jgi:hypothetical protein